MKLKIFFKCQFSFFSIVSQYGMEVKFQLDIVWDFCKRNKKKKTWEKKPWAQKRLCFVTCLRMILSVGLFALLLSWAYYFVSAWVAIAKLKFIFSIMLFSYFAVISIHSFFFAGETNSKRITFFLCKRSEIAIWLCLTWELKMFHFQNFLLLDLFCYEFDFCCISLG